MDRIEAKVIEIIDEYHLIVNAGEEAGVLVGSKVYIFSEPHDAVDPDTGEVLERIRKFKKATLEVTDVYNKVSLCESFVVETLFPFPATSLATGLTQKVKSMRPLPIDNEDASGSWPSFTKIKIGDEVVIVPHKEEEEEEEEVDYDMNYIPKFMPYEKTMAEIEERYANLNVRISVVYNPSFVEIEKEQDITEKVKKNNNVTTEINKLTEPVRIRKNKIYQNLPRANFEIVDKEIESCQEELDTLERKIEELEQQGE